jgi:hypothetical protein
MQRLRVRDAADAVQAVLQKAVRLGLDPGGDVLAGVIGAASNVGFLLIAVVGRAVGDIETHWRGMMLAGAGPALLCIFIQWFVPESHAWQAAGSRAAAPVREVFGPGLRRKTWIGILLGSVALIGTWGSVQWVPTWVGQEFALPPGLSDDEQRQFRTTMTSNAQIASAAEMLLLALALADRVRIGERRLQTLALIAARLDLQNTFWPSHVNNVIVILNETTGFARFIATTFNRYGCIYFVN